MASEHDALRARAQQVIDEADQFIAWQVAPKFQPCPQCGGHGYHHGFGERGHDPDWCSVCGGPGEVPTDPGTWAAEDVLRKAAQAIRDLLAAVEASRPALIKAFAAGFDAGFGASGEGWNAEYPFGQIGGERGERNRSDLAAQKLIAIGSWPEAPQ